MKKLLAIVCCLLISQVALFAQDKQSKDTLILGGAFRYTFMKNSWDKSHDKKGGKAIFDVAIFSVRGQLKGIEYAVENRYYAESYGGFMLRNGYVGLPLTKDLKLKLGMPRTPFGILPYTSNSFMFNMQYYLGFEDDADIGLLLEYTKEDYELQLSFAKNAEDIFSQGNNRYAYDISGQHEELNQITGRAVYRLPTSFPVEVGASLQYGGIYNNETEETGDRWAWALHTVMKKGRWDLKAEVMMYEFAADDGNDYIELGAFAADYRVANKGTCYSVALGYKIDINHLLLNDIKFYNDWSALHKAKSGYDNSYMNVSGCMLHTGPIYMLVDYVVAKNHAWIGDNYMNALAEGGDSKWNKRFNINLGVYF